MSTKIPNRQVRECVEKYLAESDDNLSAIAKRIGWYKNSGYTEGDQTRLRRALGMSKEPARSARYRTQMWDTTAIRILDAIGVDPFEAGF